MRVAGDRTRFPRHGWILLTVVLVGAALAGTGLGRQSLWLDEAYTWWFAGFDWGRLLGAARLDAVNPPFYYLYVKALAPGMSEAALRLPSVLAHVFGVAAAATIGARMGGRPGAAAAGLLWAAHPLALWAARDARPYALAAALSAVSMSLFLEARDSAGPLRPLASILALALGLMTHYFFFVFAAALLMLAGLELRRAPRFFRSWTLTTLIALIPLGAWLAWFFSSGPVSLGIGWIRTPTLSDIPLTLWNLLSGYGGVHDSASRLVGFLVMLLVIAGLARTDGRRLAIGGLLTPLLAVWVISQRRAVYVDRYFIVLLPFVAAIVAMGAGVVAGKLTSWPIRRRASAGATLAAIGALAVVVAGLAVHRSPKFMKEDWRGLAEYLQSQGAQAADLSLSEPEAALPLSRYFDPSLLASPPSPIPACDGECWWVIRQPYTATHALTQAVAEPGRGEELSSPGECTRSAAWATPTGLSVERVLCGG